MLMSNKMILSLLWNKRLKL